jgi:dipeptidyl aminopeptidase/acylaminoacyl peptidase
MSRKKPASRYGSAEGLADDLERWLRHEPIAARPTGTLERSLKWARRRPAWASLAVTAVISLILISVISTTLGLRVAKARAAIATEAEKRRVELVRLNVSAGHRLMAEGDPAGASLLFLEALRLDASNSASLEAHRRRLGSALHSAPGLDQSWFHTGAVNVARFSADGRQVVSASDDGTARIWDVATGAAVGGPLPHLASVSGALFSPDGRRVATTCADGQARIWDLVTGKMIAGPVTENESRFKRPCSPGVTFSPNGDYFLCASNALIQIRKVADGLPFGSPFNGSARVNQAAFSPDGRHVLAVCEDGLA